MSSSQVSRKSPRLESINWSGITWIHMTQPTKVETEYLGHNFPFHPLNLDDILSVIQRPKIDEYEDHVFIVLHFPCFSGGPSCHITNFNELDVFISKEYLVTIDCSGNMKTVENFFKLCQNNEQAQRGNMSDGTGYLLYLIVDKMVDEGLPLIDRLADNLAKLESTIFDVRARDTIIGLSEMWRDIITFRRTVWPMRAVIYGLETKIRRYSKIDLTNYFGDTIDHVDKVWDALDEYKEIIEALNRTNTLLASSRMNEILRVLTILATIFSALVIVSSFYGMNVFLPGGADPGGSHISWFVIAISMVLTVAGMLYFFRRKGWL